MFCPTVSVSRVGLKCSIWFLVGSVIMVSSWVLFSKSSRWFLFFLQILIKSLVAMVSKFGVYYF